jgi:tetratricopeptide (TPR) repeat protein
MADGAKPGRNDRCPCGSGRKFKLCCGSVRATATKHAATPAPRSSASARSADSLLRAADRLLKTRQYQEAIGPLSEAARLLPNNPALLDDLGTVCLLARRFSEAVAWLRSSIALRPSAPGTHHTLGLALAQWGDYEAALAAHLRAVALAPQLAEAHDRVGELLMRQGRRSEAAAAFERASAAAGDNPVARLYQAKALAAQERTDEAEVVLREVIALDSSSGVPSRWAAEAHLVLGSILIEAGRFDEAAKNFERSIVLTPSQATPYHSLVLSRRLSEADRPLVARIVSRLEERDVPEPQRMTLHFAVGKALDDLGDYAAAIRHFDAANLIRGRLHPAFDRSETRQRIDGTIARFTREYFANHAALSQDDETPVLVLGMPRSGTTLIERVVASHPRVAGGGELHFWNQHGSAAMELGIDQLAEQAHRLRGDYLRLLRGISGDAIRVTDKMPFNFLWVGLVHLLFPNARIIHCRRNPLDTCLSIYSTHFRTIWAFASNRGDLAFYYRQYLRLMDHWRSVLPSDRLLDVDYEDATAAPEEVARRLVAFCGLEWDPACLEPERNPDAVKTASMWQARQPIYRTSVERWRHYEPWLGELRDLLPPPDEL